MTRFYLSQCEFKWTHVNERMEMIWVQRELGDELFKQCNQPGYDLVLHHSNSQALPGDVYCRCDIYVDIHEERTATWFVLKYPQARRVEKLV